MNFELPITQMAKSTERAKKPEKSQEELREALELKLKSLKPTLQEGIKEYEQALEDDIFEDAPGEPVGTGETRKEAMQKNLTAIFDRAEKLRTKLDSKETLSQATPEISTTYARPDGKKETITLDFEAKLQDPDFASPKDIARYPTIVSLLNAVTRGEEAEVVDRDRIADAPGVQFIGAAKKYGHYYELYAVTTGQQANKLFNQANMGRKPDGANFNGWCVKDPDIFASRYHMGPNNPAYMFRRDGLAYALSDIRSGDVMNRDDKPANNALTVELLGSLQSQMPPKLVDAIINKNPWSKKHYNEIKENGIDNTVNAIFAKAVGEFGESSTASKKAADDAIDFMKNFEWTNPSQKALSYIYANAWLAMGYAVRSIKDWVPELHPVIESAPAALAAYYDFAMRDLRLDPSGFPDYKEKALQWAAKGSGENEDASMCYLPLTFYIRHNPEEIDSIDPQLLAKIKKDSPAIWSFLSSSLKPQK